MRNYQTCRGGGDLRVFKSGTGSADFIGRKLGFT